MPATRINSQDIRNATITDADVAAANKDGAQGTASMRTISTDTPIDLGVAAPGSGVNASADDHVHAAHVSKTDAVTTAADYLARIKLAADTTYRASLGLTSADEGVIILGPGGTGAADVRLYRPVATPGALIQDTNGAAVTTILALRATAGQVAQLDMAIAGDTYVRTKLRGDAGLQLGPGSADVDVRLWRSGAKVMRIDDGTAGAADLEVTGVITNSGAKIVSNAPAENFLTSPVTMTSANTYYDGASLTLAVGTWLLIGHVTVKCTTPAWMTARLWDKSTIILDESDFYSLTVGGGTTLPLTGIVTVSTGTLTIYASAACNDTGGTIKVTAEVNGTANKVTHLVAVRLA